MTPACLLSVVAAWSALTAPAAAQEPAPNPPREKLKVMAISAPEAAAPGEEIQARVTVQSVEPLRRPHALTLGLVGGEVMVAETELTFGLAVSSWPTDELVDSLPARLTVPRFAAGGQYALRVISPDLDLSGKAGEGVEIGIGGPMIGSVVCTVAELNGAPTALANGVPFSLCACLCGAGDADRLRALNADAAPLIALPATSDHDPYGLAADVWLARDRWDYTAFDRAVIAVLQAQPDARLLLRVFVGAPEWWIAQNPRETILFAHGRHAVELPGIAGEHSYPSLSSEKWRTDASEALRRFVSHVEGAPYADHVVGYLLASGEDGRWRYWGAAEGMYADYSRPQRAAFVAWLREKYENDIRKLRGAWQEVVNPLPPMHGGEKPLPALGWDDINVPPLPARTNHPSQSIHDPAAAPEVVDYNLFHPRQVADTIARFAAAAKKACGRRKLVGVSYGHVLDQARDRDALQTAGHIALGAVLANDDLDLLAGPSFAGAARGGAAPVVWSSLGESVRSHGKVRIDERLPADAARGAPSWRDVASALVDGGALLASGPAGLPQRATAIARASFAWDRSSVSEIGVFIDDYTMAYLAQGRALAQPLLALQQLELAQVGAPVDVWLLDDLIAGRVPDYKLYVMVDAFFLDQKTRETVRNHVARNGKIALWIAAPGALDETLSGQASLDLTGIAVAFVPKTAPLRVTVIDSSHPLLDGVPKGLEYGTTEPAGPVFFALPARSEPLGVIDVPSMAANKPQRWAGLIAREFDAWTSVYSAAPDVPAAVLRALARRAGVHLHLDSGDVVYANASLLAVHALTDGEKRVKLRGAATVRDLVSGETIAIGADTLTLAMRAGETRLLYVGDPKRYGL